MDEPPTEIDIGEVTADNLGDLLARAERGEEILITRADAPLARLVPPTWVILPRQPGRLRGKITIADDFDELPAEMRKAFEGDDDESPA